MILVHKIYGWKMICYVALKDTVTWMPWYTKIQWIIIKSNRNKNLRDNLLTSFVATCDCFDKLLYV